MTQIATITTATYCDEPVRLRAGIDASNVQYQDAEEMYGAYGAHVMDARGWGCVELQAVSTEELDDYDDDELVALLTKNGNGDVAEELVALARRVYWAMQGIEDELRNAMKAAGKGDLEATVDALSIASRLEREHGDDPATRQVAEQLLEWVDEDEDEDEDEDDMGWNYARQASRPIWWGRDASKMYFKLTSGSSFQNEWYAFDDRAQVIEHIERATTRGYSSLDDNYVSFEGEFYAYDQFTQESMAAAESLDDYVLKPDAKPAPMEDLLEAASGTGFMCFGFQPSEEDDA